MSPELIICWFVFFFSGSIILVAVIFFAEGTLLIDQPPSRHGLTWVSAKLTNKIYS